MGTAASPVLAALQQHEQAISRGERYLNRCRRCNAHAGFKCHDLRRRGVRVIVDLTVQVHRIALARWQCSRCQYTFTDYPSFILPYRRYASSSLLPLAQQYLERDDCSYQQLVAPRGRVIGYATAEGQEKIDERALHRSTLWRMVLMLGVLTTSLEEGLDLWNKHDPSSTLHRFTGGVAAHKFRSPQREQTLRTARRLLHLIDRWDRTFPETFFPRFATRPRAP